MNQISTTKRSVLDERFLKCGVCNERFWDNSKLIEHMESHEETKMLLCTICNKTFTRIQDLDKHYLLHRQLLQPYGCPACESRFVTQQQLMVHVDNIHPELTIGSKEETVKSSTTKTTINIAPKSPENPIKIVNVDSVPTSSRIRAKAGPSQEKSKSVINIQLPLPASKKSILKTAPTPVGKKRPLVWKDPIVSPEKSLRSDLTLQIIGKKRDLVILPQDANNPKRMKTASSESVPAKTSVVDVNVGANKQPTPMRSTPVTKTKLMQSISQMYDKQMPKSMADTRKGLLNTLQITSVSKGPIRVSKIGKQPFIIYSPSGGSGTQSGNSSTGAVLTPGIKIQGNVGSKVEQSVSVGSTTPDFDAVKLLSTTKLPPSVTVKIADKSKVQQVSSFDSFTKDLITQSKDQPLSPKVLFPIQATPLNVVQKANLKNIKGAKVLKFQKILPKSGCATQKNIVSISPILHVNQSPRILSPTASKVQIITLSPTKNAQSSPAQKTSTSSNLSNLAGARSTRGRKLPKNLKSSSANAEQSLTVPQFISEKEVLRNPEVEYQKFDIRLPTIRLTRLSEKDIQKKNNAQKLQAAENSSLKIQQTLNKSTKTSSVEEQFKLKSPESKGVKTEKQSQPPNKSIKQPTKRLVRKRGKSSLTDDDVEHSNSEEASTTQKIVKSNEIENVQEQSKLKRTRAGAVKLGIQFQPAGNIIQRAKANTRKVQTKGQGKYSESDPLQLIEKSEVNTFNKVQSFNTSVVGEQPKWKSAEMSEVKKYGKSETSDVEEVGLRSPVTSGVKQHIVVQSPVASGVKGQAISVSENRKDDSGKLQSIKEQPKRSTRNIAGARFKLLQNELGDEAEKETSSVGNGAEKPAQPGIVLTTRRSKRRLKQISVRVDTPIALKEAKMGKRKRGVVKKNILKEVIKKQVEAIEKEEKESNSTNVSENLNSSKVMDPSLLPPGPLKSPLPNIRIVTLTPEVMRKLKETVLKTSSETTPNHIRLVVPSEVVSKIQNTATKDQNVKAGSSSTPKVIANNPVPQVIRYSLEDMKRLKQQRKEEREKNAEKQVILKKMLEKFDEKEMKKQVKFCEKKLSRFISKHHKSHLENLKERLLNVRNLSPESGNQLFRDVIGMGCKECRDVIGGTLCSLGFGDEMELSGEDEAIQGFVALSTSRIKKRQTKKTSPQAGVKTSPKKPAGKQQKVVPKPQTNKMTKAKIQSPQKTTFSLIECSPNRGQISYLNVGTKSYEASKEKESSVKPSLTRAKRKRTVKDKDPAPILGDPFADVSIITEEKFVLKCPCQKPSCNGLHPENFFV